MIRAITFKKNEELICWNLIQTAVLHMYLLFYEWIKVSGLNLVYSERTTLFRCETLMEVSGNLDSRVAYKWYSLIFILAMKKTSYHEIGIYLDRWLNKSCKATIFGLVNSRTFFPRFNAHF